MQKFSYNFDSYKFLVKFWITQYFVYYSRTRHRGLGKEIVSKGLFAKCFISGTRQRLC